MRKLLVVFFCLYYTAGKSQNDTVLFDLKPRSLIKIDPLYLLNRFPTVQLSYENHLSPSTNISIGGGYVMNIYDDEFNTDFNDRSGVKLNVDLRYYFEETKKVIFFVGLGVDYFYINFNRSRTFGFDCNNNFSCQYYQYDTYKINRQDWRVNIKPGMLIKLGENIFFETGLGFALSFQSFRTLGKLSGFDIQYGDNQLMEEGERVLFLPIPVVQFGYRFR
jgi:hypothetical protein